MAGPVGRWEQSPTTETTDYKNSAWALWGVNNTDLFARGNEAMAGVFINVIGRLVDRVYPDESPDRPALLS